MFPDNLVGRLILVSIKTPPADPSTLTTFDLIAELEKRFDGFVLCGVDKRDGSIVFDCGGRPHEILGLADIAFDKAGEAADDLLHADDDPDDDGEFDYAAPAAPAPNPALIELTPETRYDVPSEVSHLVEVPYLAGDPEPEFLLFSSGEWGLNPCRKDGDINNQEAERNTHRHARRARPDEIPGTPAEVCRNHGSDFRDLVEAMRGFVVAPPRLTLTPGLPSFVFKASEN